MGKNTFVLTVAGQTREATIEVIIPTVLKAYFATMTVEKEIAAHEETYEIVQGDYLSAIASKKGTTVEKLKADNGLTTNDIFVGDTLLIKTEKESDKGKACFERIKNTSVGGEAYIIIETENLEGKTVKVNIKQGLEDVLAKANENIFFQHDKGSSNMAEVCVGNYANKDEYTNKEDLKNLAIIKVKLEPKNKENKKKWEDGLACATNNKAKLYLLVDAHSGNEKKGEHISYKGYKGNEDDCKISNYFLNEEDEWFEVKKKQEAPWMVFAMKEYNTYKDKKENESPLKEKIINDYHKSTTLGEAHHGTDQEWSDQVSWCASFINWCFNQTKKYRNTNKKPKGCYNSQAYSWKYDNWEKGEKSEPFYGAVAVTNFSHTGFVVGKSEIGQIVILGGNQDGAQKRPLKERICYTAISENNIISYGKPKGYKPSESEKKLEIIDITATDNFSSTR